MTTVSIFLQNSRFKCDLLLSLHKIFSDRKMPQLYLALIFDEGDVWEFAMTANGPSVKEKVLKLPQSRRYFGYSDDKGVLYFIHSEINKPVTKFHKKLSKNGHRIVAGSKRCELLHHEIDTNIGKCKHFEYSYGILLGMGFWTFGKTYQGLFYWAIDWQSTDSDIWNTKREKWLKGPEIINDFYNEKLISTALNKTILLLVIGYPSDVFMVNLKSNSWRKYPNLPIDLNEIVDSGAVLNFDKKRQR